MRRLLLLACLASLAATTAIPIQLTVTPLLAIAPTGVTIVAHVDPLQAAREITVEMIGPVNSFSAEPCPTDGHWMRREFPRLPEGVYRVTVTVYGAYGALVATSQTFERG